MKTYVYRDHRNCTCDRRRELREPIQEDINQRPEQFMAVQQFPDMPTQSFEEWERASMMYEATMTFHRYVFETVRFSTMIWVEECTEFGISCGHYRIYNSYFQVPQDVELPAAELHPPGHTMHDADTEPFRGMNGEAYYRYRMFELQRRLDELEGNRPIVTREELSEIQQQIREGEDKPVPVFETYFDDNDFRME